MQVLNTQPEKAGELTRALYKAYFVDGLDITEDDAVAQVASSIGLDGSALIADAQTDAVKEQMKAAVQESIDAGMFGAPYFVVDGEAFWARTAWSNCAAGLHRDHSKHGGSRFQQR